MTQAAVELVGRDAESAALRAALSDSRPLVLLGESGIGTTSLIEISVPTRNAAVATYASGDGIAS